MASPSELAALAEPDPLDSVGIEAWFMDSDEETDQRRRHRRSPNVPASPQQLRDLGVLYWKVAPGTERGRKRLDAIKEVRGYSYEDTIDVCPEKLENYEVKIKCFYEEHVHTDEEIRYVVSGSGFFDVRDAEDRWIRIHTKVGDLVVLPEGIYHRFTLDEGNKIVANRLFVGEPVWKPHNRPQEGSGEAAPSRRNTSGSFWSRCLPTGGRRRRFERCATSVKRERAALRFFEEESEGARGGGGGVFLARNMSLFQLSKLSFALSSAFDSFFLRQPHEPAQQPSLIHGMRGAAAAAVSRNCNSATPPSTSAPSSSIPSLRRHSAAAPSPRLRASSSRRRASSPSFVVTMATAASAPSAAAPTLKTYDAASMSTQDLLAFTARPRVDFDSILATVRDLFPFFLRSAFCIWHFVRSRASRSLVACACCVFKF